jgi:CHAT domain-containing protein
MVLADQGIDEGTAEVSAIRDILAGRADVGDEISEKAKLREVLGGGGFSLLHVAGHNAYGRDAGLVLANGHRLRPPDLNGLAASGGRWTAARPLIFLNACGTDADERTYTGVTGWAEKCFKAGAGAFVGSLWDVRSKPARAFATSFYRALLEDGHPLAIAAHLARNEALRQSSRDPTWLAYTVYGNPFARAVSAGALRPGDVSLPH